MTVFKVGALDQSGQVRTFLYDNSNSTLSDESGVPCDTSHIITPKSGDSGYVSPVQMEGKTSKLKRLRIQLGLSCNYSCDYCSQRFVPHADSTSPSSVPAFMEELPRWFDGGKDGLGTGVKIELWGGEPFVYWKTLKPLAEALRARYPNVQFLIITNGSLLDEKKNAWLDSMGFSVGLSHDGPGQHVRGPDPLDDPKQREAIMNLFNLLHPKGRFSFNFVLNSKSTSRKAVYEFFRDLTGVENVSLGEGSLIDAYDEGGLGKSLSSPGEMQAFGVQSFNEIATDIGIEKVSYVNNQVLDFIQSIKQGRRAESLDQKCSMNRSDNIAVDLNGNILTCQNVSAVSVAGNGLSHKIGHVSNLEAAIPVTALHWTSRDGCSRCPVLHLCKGSCMFLTGKLWDASCDNSFADNIVFFAVAFELITGCRPFKVEGGMPQREEIWNIKPLSNRRVIPIAAM